MAEKVAYWISPGGEVVPVPVNHIGVIIHDPERFGLSTRIVRAAYRKHKEPMGLEGYAREELIGRAVANGWIRLRRYHDRYWSVTLQVFDAEAAGRLAPWARKVLGRGVNGFRERDREMPVRIVPLGNGPAKMLPSLRALTRRGC